VEVFAMDKTKEKVIEHLTQWRAELAKRTEFSSIEEKAEHIGLLNVIELNISQLRLCEEFGIVPSAQILVLPDIIRSCYQPEYRIVEDSESDDPAHWREVVFPEAKRVRLTDGDIVIRK
jgi:hypothetical protein